ncbi:MAG: aminodeoxychorismate lyase [Sulfuricaulis sp.]
MITLINGMPGAAIALHDRGFQYGDGLFETLAVEQGMPLLWDRHMQRLQRGAARLGINMPPTTTLRDDADEVCHGIARGVLKIILTRGLSGRGYAPIEGGSGTRTVSLSPWPDYPVRHRTHGVAVQFCRTMIGRNPALAGIKHLNRLEQVLARAELGKDFAEGLMLDEQCNVIEGTMSNVFAVSGHTLLTPDLTHSGVEGVMRGFVLQQASARSLPVRVTTLTREDILRAEEIFLTNSLIGLWPVRQLESQEFPAGNITTQLQEAIRDAYVAV